MRSESPSDHIQPIESHAPENAQPEGNERIPRRAMAIKGIIKLGVIIAGLKGGEDVMTTHQPYEPPPDLPSSFRQERFACNGIVIDAIGVAHAINNYKAHRPIFEQAIQKCSTLVIEAAPIASKYFRISDASAEIYDHYLETGTSDYSTSIQKLEKEQPMILFFYAIEKLGHKFNKRLATLDPYSLNISPDDQKTTGFLDRKADDPFKQKILNILIGAATMHTMDDEAWMNKRMSRREFLNSLLFTSGAALAAYNFVTVNEYFRRTMLEYRNAYIALGLFQLTKTMKPGETIALVYGSAHLSGIQKNLEILASGGQLASFPDIEPFVHPKIEQYIPEGSNDWKKIIESSIQK